MALALVLRILRSVGPAVIVSDEPYSVTSDREPETMNQLLRSQRPSGLVPELLVLGLQAEHLISHEPARSRGPREEPTSNKSSDDGGKDSNQLVVDDAVQSGQQQHVRSFDHTELPPNYPRAPFGGLRLFHPLGFGFETVNYDRFRRSESATSEKRCLNRTTLARLPWAPFWSVWPLGLSARSQQR